MPTVRRRVEPMPAVVGGLAAAAADLSKIFRVEVTVETMASGSICDQPACGLVVALCSST